MTQHDMDQFKMIQRAYILLDEIRPAIEELNELRCKLYYDDDDVVGDFHCDIDRLQYRLEEKAKVMNQRLKLTK